MRMLLIITLLIVSVSLIKPAQAQPPLWQNNFGDELSTVSNCDDCEEEISLPFPFPFNGSLFDTAYVGSNGCIQLGGLGLDGHISYEYWDDMQEFLSDSDPDNPIICPFGTDLDTSEGGAIYYNSNGNPLIITWDGVSAHDTDALTTFQILLYSDGRIVINYDGIFNGPGENLIDLEQGIVAGVTPSDFPYDGEAFVPGDPGPVDLVQGPFNFGPTVYGRWCYDEADSCGVEGSDTGLPGPINTAFDLDFSSICFIPNGGGFAVSSAFEGDSFICELAVVTPASPIPTMSEWGMIAMAGILGVIGFMVIRRRKITA
jgi:hypothetical protein